MTHVIDKIFSDVFIFTPTSYADERGYFLESYNPYIANYLNNINFLQDNHSKSIKNVFRGFHYQYNGMAKLLRVVNGQGLAIIIDIRKSSPTYGLHSIIELNDINNNILFTPVGFAQGFLSLADNTHLCYKCSSLRNEKFEGTLHPFDDVLNIQFPIDKSKIILSQKDKSAASFLSYNNNPKFL